MDKSAEVAKWASVLDLNIKAQLDKQLLPFDINSSQYFYILKICAHPGTTRDMMFEHTYKNPSNISRALDQLENKGFFTKEQNVADKRKYHLFPTEKAFAAREEILRILRETIDQVFIDFSEDDREFFLGMIRTAGKRAYEYNSRERCQRQVQDTKE